MQKQVSIVDFYCSEIGINLSNMEVLQYIVDTLPDVSSKKKVWFYEKILKATPERTRKLVSELDSILMCPSREQRQKNYEEVVRKLMVDAVKGLFEKSYIKASDIDFLVVTSSVGITMPSAASILANSFSFKDQLVTLNLGGMSCSSGLAALDTGMRFLKSESKACRCLVISLEAVSNLFNLSENNIAPNSLFGEGCAAVILSTYKEASLYKIKHSVRTISADEDSFNAIRFAESDEGPSINLSRKLAQVSAKPIGKNLRILIPKLLSLPVKFKYLLDSKVPQWQKLIDYWAIHPGGTEILNGVSDSLNLSQGDLGFSHRVFMRRSNMSSPSIFYVLDEIEKQKPKKNSNVLMLTFGAGFKVNSMLIKRVDTRRELTKNMTEVSIELVGDEVNVSYRKSLTTEAVHIYKKNVFETDMELIMSQSWRATLGVDRIVIQNSVISAFSPEFVTDLLVELYNLLLPHGTFVINSVESGLGRPSKNVSSVVSLAKQNISYKYKAKLKNFEFT